MDPSLIIFDCDGVLVDSEPLSNRVLAEQISELGFPMTAEEALNQFAGGSLERVQEFVQEKLNIEVGKDFENEYRIRSTHLFRNELTPIPGIKQLLDSIKVPKCVGSNGPYFKIAENLKLTQLEDYFGGNYYSAYDIQKWKPLPDLYLHAAKEMGVDPKECIVIEDSIHGVRAAKAAGIKVFGFNPHGNADMLRKEGAVLFNRMEDLIGQLVL